MLGSGRMGIICSVDVFQEHCRDALFEAFFEVLLASAAR
ncbi:hypothetical protein BLL52_2134 [Rhodoferax antarcticus ANT.BR]|uniref:Uncharacterized protein n=1 Tax=Rhodoferax antarcticus ANT.BR TaxID=1111071 RepID=A0A1Q8YD29_9BURK|nr:hypothetical protein BLL52_2134 [Rhodoferax antarcticus ANT.BR]